jgi:hypothetical protein
MTGYCSHSVTSLRNYKRNTVTNLKAKVTMRVGIMKEWNSGPGGARGRACQRIELQLKLNPLESMILLNLILNLLYPISTGQVPLHHLHSPYWENIQRITKSQSHSMEINKEEAPEPASSLLLEGP